MCWGYSQHLTGQCNVVQAAIYFIISHSTGSLLSLQLFDFEIWSTIQVCLVSWCSLILFVYSTSENHLDLLWPSLGYELQRGPWPYLRG